MARPVVLVIDDSPFQLTLIHEALTAAGCHVETVSTPRAFLRRVALPPPEQQVAVAVVDFLLSFPEDGAAGSGGIYRHSTAEREVLAPLRCWQLPPPVVVYSGRAVLVRQRLIEQWRPLVAAVLPKGSRRELEVLVETVRNLAYPTSPGMAPGA